MQGSDFRRGLRDVAPLLPGVVPFGVVAGIASANAGLELWEAVTMSVAVFAGAAQLAALELLGTDAPLAVVVMTATVINLRMLMYSASIAPYFRELAGRWKAGLAYLLTDQAYALSITAYRSDDGLDRKAYYLATAFTLWVSWQLTTVGGYLVGAGIPDGWGLEFTVPLVFLAVLGPAIEDRPSLVAATIGGGGALAAAGLPLNLGLLVGALVGILGGLAAESTLEGHRGD
jgi:4-azaleucine resistance transporter AzlC